MSAHTPGPWTIEADDRRLYIVSSIEVGPGLRQAVAEALSLDNERADARLIAAAPALLEAAIAWAGVMDRCTDTWKLATDDKAPEVMKQMRAAIKAATEEA